ncbi:MAG: LysM peptidoglycan-binding domain-containing protein [Deltaproteobacteria bacterium]|nr:LysM peptidoglycan-binding domain-containing protein [Deltaproteobacteria bacterium]
MISKRMQSPVCMAVLIFVLLSVLCGCAAHAPVRERQEAEETLQAAMAAEAPVYAPEEYAKAQENFYLGNIEMEKRQFSKASDLLKDSKEEAQLAVSKSRAGKAIKLAREQLNESDLVQLRRYITDVCSISEKSLKKAESAFKSEKYSLAKQEAQMSIQISNELPKLLEKRIIEEDGKSIEKEEISRQAKAILEEAERKAAAIIEEAKKEAAAILAQVLERRFPSSYTVRVGDKLRLIASRREIYNDPYQWPLIYKANRDQIRDPHILFVGQQLIIPRDLMIEEVKEARKQAGASPPYDIPPEAFHPSDYK